MRRRRRRRRLLSQAASLTDFYVAVEALINDRREHERRLAALLTASAQIRWHQFHHLTIYESKSAAWFITPDGAHDLNDRMLSWHSHLAVFTSFAPVTLWGESSLNTTDWCDFWRISSKSRNWLFHRVSCLIQLHFIFSVLKISHYPGQVMFNSPQNISEASQQQLKQLGTCFKPLKIT